MSEEVNPSIHTFTRRGGTISLEKIKTRPPRGAAFRIFTLLIISKCLHSLSTLITREWLLLRGVPVSVVTFCVLAAGGLFLNLWQKVAATPHRTVTSLRWSKVGLITISYTAHLYFWFTGLSRLGSTRTLMITQYSDIWSTTLISYALNYGSASSHSSSMKRGTQLILIAFIASFFIDFTIASSARSKLALQTNLEDQFDHFSVTNLVIGYASLLFSILLLVYQRDLTRKFAVDVGGNRRLFAITVPLGALLISPVAFVQHLMYSTSMPGNVIWIVLTFSGVGFGLIAFDFSVSHEISMQVSTIRYVTIGWPLSIVSVTTVALICFYGDFSTVDIVIGALFYTGILYLIGSDQRYINEAHFPSPGFSQSAFDLLPLHDSNTIFVSPLKTPVLLASGLRGYIKSILDNENSRQIFYFLMLNVSYMFVQMLYGIWTNSLGLISDAIHMFFDCLALAMGLFASIMSKWAANNKFTYGYGRIETLSGFANGIFLVLISIFILFEAVARLIDPPEMNTDRLLLVSFLGLVVNLIGIFAFNHGHAHHGHSHGNPHDHCSHDHHSDNHGFDHHKSHHHGDSANMQGIYLHILADTLGSIGVIVSTILIEQFGWTGFDPLASIFIACLIFMSVLPLIKNSASVLMLALSEQMESKVDEGLEQILQIPGVTSYTVPRFWPSNGDCLIGSIHVQTTSEVDASKICAKVTTVLKSRINGLNEMTVQVENMNGFLEKCFCHLNSLQSTNIENFSKRKSH